MLQVDESFLTEFEHYARELGLGVISYTQLPREYIFSDKAVLFDNVIILSMEMDFDKMEMAPSPQTQIMILQTYNDLGIISNICDNVAVMYSGNIIEYEPVKDVPLENGVKQSRRSNWVELRTAEGKLACKYDPLACPRLLCVGLLMGCAAFLMMFSITIGFSLVCVVGGAFLWAFRRAWRRALDNPPWYLTEAKKNE